MLGILAVRLDGRLNHEDFFFAAAGCSAAAGGAGGEALSKATVSTPTTASSSKASTPEAIEALSFSSASVEIVFSSSLIASLSFGAVRNTLEINRAKTIVR
jgi:hypothetical protein